MWQGMELLMESQFLNSFLDCWKVTTALNDRTLGLPDVECTGTQIFFAWRLKLCNNEPVNEPPFNDPYMVLGTNF